MAKFRKKPFLLEATKLTEANATELKCWSAPNGQWYLEDDDVSYKVNVGDWIVSEHDHRYAMTEEDLFNRFEQVE